jgi:ubiquinone/menaquinone biosynthesis C-methylase UbiE
MANDRVHDQNYETYTTSGVVRHYAQLQQLQPAETAVLTLLRDQLPGMKMLDIGVGGGRTTSHFSGIVAEYTGIDYATAMITACRARFPGSDSSMAFEVCDARDMRRFTDNSFDFILFSFNGIDYISHAERLQVFREILRIGKSGGYFCFSSHNLGSFERMFDVTQQLHLNPLTTYVNLMMLSFLRLFNFPVSLKQIRNSDHIVLKDESHNFCLNTYYVRAQEQINQLAPNFRDIKIYSWKSGLELASDQALRDTTDLWLYYLCVIHKDDESNL